MTVLWLTILAASAAIREGGVALRSSCGPEESVVAQLTAGTAVDIRFAVTSSIACYKVTAVVNGQTQQGYVPASAVENSASFERERRAGDTAAVQVMKPETKLQPAASGDAVLHKSWQLIQANQPREALAVLEPSLPRYKQNPQALALAGLAAYRSDNPRAAVEYWEQSLALEANPNVELLRTKAQRELTHDKSSDSAQGLRVVLRYEGTRVPANLAREMITVLDDESGRIAKELGCSFDERVAAVVQTPAAYRATTAAAEWSGGMYDGRIHVPLTEGNQVTVNLKRTFAHELVHACLSNMGRFPAWLHEGLAQRLSGEVLPESTRAMVREAIAMRAVPRLEQLGQSWSGLSAEHARLAYGVAFLAAEHLERNHGGVGVRTVLSNPGLLEHITKDLNKSLGLQ